MEREATSSNGLRGPILKNNTQKKKGKGRKERKRVGPSAKKKKKKKGLAQAQRVAREAEHQYRVEQAACEAKVEDLDRDLAEMLGASWEPALRGHDPAQSDGAERVQSMRYGIKEEGEIEHRLPPGTAVHLSPGSSLETHLTPPASACATHTPSSHPVGEEGPDEYYCPITCELMEDPVLAADGHSYERGAIEAWLATHATSPKSGEELPSNALIPNHALRNLIADWAKEYQ